MSKNLHPPEKLCLKGNLKENFRKFKKQFTTTRKNVAYERHMLNKRVQGSTGQ